ncbi:23783_t:CDS:2, partial [Gigaspora margarita]
MLHVNFIQFIHRCLSYSINYFTGSPYTNVFEYYDRGYSNKIQPDKEGCILFHSGYLDLFPALVALFDITLTPSSSTTNASFDLTSYLNNSFVLDNKTYKYEYSVIPFIEDVLNFLVGSIGYSPNLPNYDLTPNIQKFPKLRDDERIQFAIKIPTHIRHETHITEFSSSFKTGLAKRYVSSSGIPLSHRVLNRRNNATLEDCVPILETLLSGHYLDNYQWEMRCSAIIVNYRYNKILNKFEFPKDIKIPKNITPPAGNKFKVQQTGITSLGIRLIIPKYDTSRLITTAIVGIPKPDLPEDIVLGLEKTSNDTGKGSFDDITYIIRPLTRDGHPPP